MTAVHTLAFELLVLLVVIMARFAELWHARRSARRARARGAVEVGRAHFPLFVLLHSGYFFCLVVEVLLGQGRSPVNWTVFGLFVAAQGLRVWCIRSLGPAWNVRILIIPDGPLVTSGPYRFLRHPNYWAVIVEMFSLAVAFDAFITACVFTLANFALIRHRIRVEEYALRRYTAYAAVMRPAAARGSRTAR